MQIENSVALITGGVSGLGFGAASRFVAHGGRVVMMDINEELGKAAQDQLGSQARFVKCDVSSPEEVTAAVEGAAGAFDRIDILVNAAGVAPAQRVLSRDGDMFDLELFRFTVGVNLIGMFDVIRNTARVMSRNEPNDGGERGVVVNVASIAAFEGQVGQAAYSAAKGGITTLTLVHAAELGRYGITANTIVTGMTTAMTTAGNIITAPMTTSISMHTRRRITTAAIIITEQGLPASLLPA